MESATISRLGVSIPVVADFQGTLTRGVTQDLGLDTISFLTDFAPSAGTSVSVLFYFSHNVAYMPLAGQVTAVTEESGDPTTQFQIDVQLLSLGDTERRILESTFHELEVYLQSLGAPESSTRAAARAMPRDGSLSGPI